MDSIGYSYRGWIQLCKNLAGLHGATSQIFVDSPVEYSPELSSIYFGLNGQILSKADTNPQPGP
jgi:hypothetical protein